MKIVIEISSYDKEWITNGYYIPEEINMRISEAIANGTPLEQTDGDLIAEIDKLPRIKVGNSNSPTVKYCIDENLIYDLLGNYKAEKTAELQPIVRGKWEEQTDKSKMLYGWYFCSNCNAVICEKTPFCPNCGAKMEESGETE